ncbi:MAG: hypothetical protein KDB27_15615, partial [Planctomycetales bacterium]|nr:hypothetical protein [Planctomycetales bacterium]
MQTIKLPRLVILLLVPLVIAASSQGLVADPTANGDQGGNQTDCPEACDSDCCEEEGLISQLITIVKDFMGSFMSARTSSWAGSNRGPGSPTQRRRGSLLPQVTRNPIHLLRGSVLERAVDVQIPGLRSEWSHQRSYDSRLVDGSSELPGENGIRWFSGVIGPHIWEDKSTGNLELYVSASSKRVFDKNGSTWDPPTDYAATLTKQNANTSSETYTIEHVDTGEVFIFYGVHWTVDANNRGRLKERTTRAYENVTPTKQDGITYAYGSNGVSSVTTSQGWSASYNYFTTGTESGRLDYITVEDGSSTTIQKVEYDYVGTTAPHADTGSTGDLLVAKVSIKESNSSSFDERYTLYRYYTSGDTDGKQHQLKMVFEPDAVERILNSGNTAVDTVQEILEKADTYVVKTIDMVDKTLADYASRTFTYYTSSQATSSVTTPWTANEDLNSKYGGSELTEYDSSNGHGFVKTETINGACGSCGSSAAGGVKKSYFYMTVSHSSPTPSDVIQIVVEDTESSASSSNEVKRTIYGLNSQGVALRTAIIVDPTQSTLTAWCKSVILDSERRITEERMPSAHTLVNTNSELISFLDPSTSTNDSATLNSSSGLIYKTEYEDDTNGNLVSVSRIVTNLADSMSPDHYVFYTEYGDGTTVPRRYVVETREYSTKVEPDPMDPDVPRDNGIAT